MLSKKERMFVEAYDGDEAYAMRIAGYTGADSYLKKRAHELLVKPEVLEAIKERSKYIVKQHEIIATREERQAFWTAVMRNNDPHHKEEFDANNVPLPETNIPLATRLKASELLGKSEADFIDRVDMTSNVTITDLVAQSYQSADDIDTIEAEYELARNKGKAPLITAPTGTLEDFI